MAYRRGDNDRPEVLGHGFIEATTWGEGMSGDHNMHQKPRSYLDDFECPRCGHCCKSDLATVGEVGVWGAVQCEPQEALEDGWCDWVCPKPRGYLMQCCDCELIHEVDFRVVRYESEDSEVYEVVDDHNLEAQMRLRRRDDLSTEFIIEQVLKKKNKW